MVISGVADRLEKRPRRLVYINAFVPLKGQSLNDMVTRLCCGLRRNSPREQRRNTAPIRDIGGENFITTPISHSHDPPMIASTTTVQNILPTKFHLQRPLSELSDRQVLHQLPAGHLIAPQLSVASAAVGALGLFRLVRCPEVTRPSFKSNWTRSSNREAARD